MRAVISKHFRNNILFLNIYHSATSCENKLECRKVKNLKGSKLIKGKQSWIKNNRYFSFGGREEGICALKILCLGTGLASPSGNLWTKIS